MKYVVPVSLLGALTSCAGVYGEVAATRLSASVEDTGTTVDVGTSSTIGFNLGLEFGNTSQRFAMGYARESQSFDGGKEAFSGAAFRYDFNIVNLADNLKLRVGLGVEAGNGTGTYGGKTSDDNASGGIAGLAATYFLPWDNALHVMIGGAYKSATVSGKGFTARVALSHKFGVQHRDTSWMKKEQSESDDPIVAKLKAGGHNLSPDEVVAELRKSCDSGNRWSCLFHGINAVQRGGDRAALAQTARQVRQQAHVEEDMLHAFSHAMVECLEQDDWAQCQTVKAKFVTHYRWAVASGPSFAKLFPAGTPPDDFPMAALDKVPAGSGWSCFRYSGVVKTYVNSEGPNVNVEAVNLGCERTVEACKQLLATTAGSNVTTVGDCVPYDGVLYLFDERSHYVEEQLCTDQAKARGVSARCVPVGDVVQPGL